MRIRSRIHDARLNVPLVRTGNRLARSACVGLTVLVVEDVDAARNGLVQALTVEGFEAVGAANGEEALAYLRQGHAVNVILLDLVMPVMDGWQFRRAQLQDPWIADIPVIALTALEGRPVTGVSGAAALQKPICLAELVATLRDVCARSGALRSLPANAQPDSPCM